MDKTVKRQTKTEADLQIVMGGERNCVYERERKKKDGERKHKERKR